jgi:hypothetical protein
VADSGKRPEWKGGAQGRKEPPLGKTGNVTFLSFVCLGCSRNVRLPAGALLLALWSGTRHWAGAAVSCAPTLMWRGTVEESEHQDILKESSGRGQAWWKWDIWNRGQAC